MAPPSALRLSTVSLIKTLATYERVKTGLFFYVLCSYLLRSYRHILSRGIRLTARDAYTTLARFGTKLFLSLPSVKAKVESQMAEARRDIEAKLVPSGPNVTRHLALPETGHDLEWIEKEMEQMDVEAVSKTNWRHGKISGAVYHGGEDMEEIIFAAMKRYIVSNQLHPDVFPAIRKMDAEIVAMCLRMYNNPNGAGTTTSGGTESILMSCKTHRDWARATKRITAPEMVIPASAHAAFHKASAYFGIKLHVIDVDPVTRKVDLRRVRRAINSNTILLVGSAINFPDGCQDDIVALAVLAKKYGTGLHVDCCLGSFIMPFLEKNGFPVQPFDFRVDGVTAISCDTHKYGFAPKGSSVVMYRSSELRRYQYYIQPDWTGGVYASPSIAGSRPGAVIAGTWAAMQYMGYQGYLESCRSIVGCAKKIEATIRSDDEFPDLHILGDPPASVVAFAAKPESGLNILEVGDVMSSKGWHLNALSQPSGVHIACTRLTVPNVDQFIADLKDAVEEAKLKPKGSGSMVAIYGLGNSSAVGQDMVGELAGSFIDAMYKA